MKFRINDEKKELTYICEDDSEAVAKKFISSDVLKNRNYTLYAYVEMVGEDLYVKFGEAKKQSVFARYDITGHMANKHMIAVWSSFKGDKEIHTKLAIRAKNNRGYAPADYDVINTVEAYRVTSKLGLDNLLADISEYAVSKVVTSKQTRKDYADVIKLVEEIYNADSKFNYADLCTRWGKTGTFLLLAKTYAERNGDKIFVVASYVATVKHSYSEEIENYTNNSNAKFIDPDVYETTEDVVEAIKEWIAADSHNYVVYYVALTGGEDTCFNRRIAPFNSFENEGANLLVEEADFGSACQKQIEKLKKLFN